MSRCNRKPKPKPKNENKAVTHVRHLFDHAKDQKSSSTRLWTMRQKVDIDMYSTVPAGTVNATGSVSNANIRIICLMSIGMFLTVGEVIG